MSENVIKVKSCAETNRGRDVSLFQRSSLLKSELLIFVRVIHDARSTARNSTCLQGWSILSQYMSVYMLL